MPFVYVSYKSHHFPFLLFPLPLKHSLLSPHSLSSSSSPLQNSSLFNFFVREWMKKRILSMATPSILECQKKGDWKGDNKVLSMFSFSAFNDIRERFDEIGKKIKREADAYYYQMGRTHMGPHGVLNTITPCAACKLLRRRCAQECPFFPYFSPHEPQKFASVHKVFGASNVSKMLMEVSESQRVDAANSLVYEANLRLRDPVYGCMGAILALQQQVQSLEAELNAVRTQIMKLKYSESNILPTSQVTFLNSPGAVSVAAPSHPPPSTPPSPLALPPLSSSSVYHHSTTPTNDHRTTSSQNTAYFP